MRAPYWVLTIHIVGILSLPIAAHADSVRIGVVIDGQWGHRAELLEMFQKEIRNLTATGFDVTFPDELEIVGDWTLPVASAAVDQLLANQSCDIVLALGVLSSYAAAQHRDLKKPVIAPFVVNPAMQDLVTSDGTSGVHNLSFLTSPFDPVRDVEVFRDVQQFDTLAVMIGVPFANAIPNLETSLRTRLERIVPSVTFILVDQSATEALAEIPTSAQAVYIGGISILPASQFAVLVDGINSRGLPSFSMLGRPDVELGIMYGIAPSTTFLGFARRVAIHVHSILRGENASTLPVGFSSGERLSINMQTARAIDVYPTWRVITEAELINPEPTNVARTWDLRTVLTAAFHSNLALQATERELEASRKEVNKAWSNWLPQGDISAVLSQIDEDRAAAGFGTNPEKLLTGSAGFTQLLFSEDAMANVSIQKKLLRGREHNRDRVELDVSLGAATAFFDVLRAKTIERIERDNLRLTRENLERARIRRSVGVASPGEVYRWEVEMANARTSVINANAGRNLAEIEFNRVLNRPLEEAFATVETGVEDPTLIYRRDVFEGSIDDPKSFGIFRGFMVQEALAHSPEILALDEQIDAQGRFLTSTKWSFIAPTLALQGDIAQRFWKDGVGVNPPSFPPPNDLTFPGIDDTNWSVGIVATLDIFRGGAKLAERSQASEELAALRVRRNDLANVIEQHTRVAMHRFGASYAGIEYSAEAAEAARKNLDLVQDAYTRGTVSIIDLLDAQNSSFRADNQAANAIYDFLIDLMQVERAIGNFYFLADDEERAGFADRMQDYMQTHR